MKLIIPQRLKVGAHWYTVELKKDYHVMERSSASTQKAPLKMIIDNSEYRPHSIIEENFIHEILHAIFTEIGFHWTTDREFTTTEENLVERLAPVLYQILVDNKIQENNE